MGTHEYEDDPRNEDVLISVNGELFPRKEAKVSVFDSGFLLGDGVWESFRLHDGKLVFIEEHLDRLFHGASEISLDPGRSREEIRSEINRVISANEMHDNVHLRLIVSRGLKPTPYQAPWVISSKPTIVIIPEFKKANEKGQSMVLGLSPSISGEAAQRFRILGLTVSPSTTALLLASRQIIKGGRRV